MPFPIGSETTAEDVGGFDQLLLFFNPWGDDLLFFDDLVHEVFGSVEKWTVGVVILLCICTFSSRDVLELAS